MFRYINFDIPKFAYIIFYMPKNKHITFDISRFSSNNRKIPLKNPF